MSPLHPFVKVLALLASMVIVVIRPGVQGQAEGLLLWLCCISILLAINGTSLQGLLAAVKLSLTIGLLLVVSQGIIVSGAQGENILIPIGEARKIVLSERGLRAGGVAFLKLLVVVLSGQLLAAKTAPEEFAVSLNRFGVPLRISNLLTLAMRFVPIIQERWRASIDARRLRGIDVDRLSFFKKAFRLYPGLVVPLIVSLFRAGLDLEISLVGRGYYLEGKKTQLEEVAFHKMDRVSLALIFIAAPTAIAMVF